MANTSPPLLHLDRNSTAADRTIEITTTGARTRRAHRQEIWFYRAFNTTYLTGRPGPRDWYANILANPHLTIHIHTPTPTDLSALGKPITDTTQRQQIFTTIIEDLLHSPNLPLDGPPPVLNEWVTHSPLVEVIATAQP
ncbi:nitroreductase/quinone reductase family protein [Nocardia africana]|uniref:Nitroreductase/quinone reductase family protein n=1 Tax=Nocardia africana TaxID=134964 RepID=A0ABW6NCU2_9NOCA